MIGCEVDQLARWNRKTKKKKMKKNMQSIRLHPLWMETISRFLFPFEILFSPIWTEVVQSSLVSYLTTRRRGRKLDILELFSSGFEQESVSDGTRSISAVFL